MPVSVYVFSTCAKTVNTLNPVWVNFWARGEQNRRGMKQNIGLGCSRARSSDTTQGGSWFIVQAGWWSWQVKFAEAGIAIHMPN